MRIAVIGAGGVGGYFGARLAEAGEDVSFIARGAHLEAMRKDGLRVESSLGDLTVKPVRAAATPLELGPEPFDLVVIAVKLWSTDEAIATARSLAGPRSSVVSFQNGVGAIDALTKAFGSDRVLGGVCHIATAISAPGVIKHTGTMERFTIGEPAGGISPRVTAIVEAAKRAKLNAIASDDIRRAIWEKFLFLATFSGVATLARLPKSGIFADPDLRRVYADALAEAIAVARASGINLPADHAETVMRFSEGLPDTMKPSLLHDFERGNRLEVEFLSGAVARIGAQHGVPTPVHRTIYAALKSFAAGRPVA
ncbi:MAG TPA: ketopantoate reductase family protein [Alphaproteobacteria bacterium]|nr:ketopantoate reductase family protein [Alphaproteobacteria bacterium]